MKIETSTKLIEGTISDGIEVAKGGLGLERFWFWRHRGIGGGKWSEKYPTRKAAINAALRYWN